MITVGAAIAGSLRQPTSSSRVTSS
jgi:hypothetical protein